MQNQAQYRKLTPKKRLKLVLIVFGVVALGLFMWRWSTFRISKNFYEVDPGKFYRSAQLTPDELDEVIKKYGIKTVISLRGAPKNSYWVPGEIETAKKDGAAFYDFAFTIDYFPKREDIIGYMNLLKTAEKPILVHCRTGADRTGEATALYAREYMGQSTDQAIDNWLNFKFWHVQAFHPAKAEFVREYKGYDWLLNTYDLCKPEFRKYAEPGACSN